MGILNVTPDSFSDGGRYLDPSRAIDRARAMVGEGADLVDVGGESTRPGSAPVSTDEEMDRVLPVVETLVDEGMIVSIDTTKPEVARSAIVAGAEVINDITGMGDPEMRRVAAETGAGVVVMHMRGTPLDMQDRPHYEDVVAEVGLFLRQRVTTMSENGVERARVVIDPGIGFGKTLAHNLALLNHLGELGRIGPVLLGVSRKSMYRGLLGIENPEDRDLASAVTAALAVSQGVRLFRVHNVDLHRRTTMAAWAMVREQS